MESISNDSLKLDPTAGASVMLVHTKTEDPGFDLMTPYAHLIKMLDAAALLQERGVVKIRKTHQADVLKE